MVNFKKFPTPMDRHVRQINKNFKALKKEVVQIWCQDVVRGHLAARHYADLQTARLSFATSGERVTPVMTLRFPMAEELSAQLELYLRFVSVYGGIREKILQAVGTAIGVYFVPKSRPEALKEAIRTQINIMCILVTAMNQDVLTAEHLDTIVRAGYEDGYEPLHEAIQEMGLGWVIDMGEGKAINTYVHDELICAFYKYVRKPIG